MKHIHLVPADHGENGKGTLYHFIPPSTLNEVAGLDLVVGRDGTVQAELITKDEPPIAFDRAGLPSLPLIAGRDQAVEERISRDEISAYMGELHTKEPAFPALTGLFRERFLSTIGSLEGIELNRKVVGEIAILQYHVLCSERYLSDLQYQLAAASRDQQGHYLSLLQQGNEDLEANRRQLSSRILEIKADPLDETVSGDEVPAYLDELHHEEEEAFPEASGEFRQALLRVVGSVRGRDLTKRDVYGLAKLLGQVKESELVVSELRSELAASPSGRKQRIRAILKRRKGDLRANKTHLRKTIRSLKDDRRALSRRARIQLAVAAGVVLVLGWIGYRNLAPMILAAQSYDLEAYVMEAYKPFEEELAAAERLRAASTALLIGGSPHRSNSLPRAADPDGYHRLMQYLVAGWMMKDLGMTNERLTFLDFDPGNTPIGDTSAYRSFLSRNADDERMLAFMDEAIRNVIVDDVPSYERAVSELKKTARNRTYVGLFGIGKDGFFLPGGNLDFRTVGATIEQYGGPAEDTIFLGVGTNGTSYFTGYSPSNSLIISGHARSGSTVATDVGIIEELIGTYLADPEQPINRVLVNSLVDGESRMNFTFLDKHGRSYRIHDRPCSAGSGTSLQGEYSCFYFLDDGSPLRATHEGPHSLAVLNGIPYVNTASPGSKPRIRFPMDERGLPRVTNFVHRPFSYFFGYGDRSSP